MEQVTIPISTHLKEQVEEELSRTGMTWNEMFENFLGKEASPSVDKALREAYASGDHPKIYSDVDEMFTELYGENWNA